MDVPAGATNVSFSMTGGSGDADLYVTKGAHHLKQFMIVVHTKVVM